MVQGIKRGRRRRHSHRLTALCRTQPGQATSKDFPLHTHLPTAASLRSPCRRTLPWRGRAAWATLALSLLGGCATAPRLTPIGKGASIAMVVIKSPQAEGQVDIHNQALGNDTAVGAGSGAMVGGLYGLTCGPFVVLCIPLGMGVGAIYGTVAGAAVGATAALPADKAARVRDRLGRAQQSHDLLEELRRNVNDSARKHWNLSSDPSATVVTVELQDMRVTSTRDERVSLIVRVRVSVRPSGPPPQTATTQTHYEYVGAFSSLAVWLDEESNLLDATLSSAALQIATQIVAELASN